jgi:acyl carrier protein
MEETQIKQQLTSVFREVFDDDSIVLSDTMTARNIDGWDSLNHINLIVAIENSFKVKFTTKEVSNLANVGEFVALIATKLR